MSRSTFCRVLAAGAVVALSACAPAPSTAHAPTPAPRPDPCADSVYVALKRQHPDSLSERAWQRLQALDRECAAARAQATHAQDGGMMGMGMGMGHGRGGWRLLGLATIAVMVVMMSAL